MPIYEYACVKCKNGFEYLVLGNNDHVSCPECGSKRVIRKMSLCAHKSASGDSMSSSETSSSGCASCAGGNCSACH